MGSLLRKMTVALCAVLVLLLPVSASASTYVGTETYSLGTDEVAEGNVYVAGTTITISGTVEGDLLAGGSTITLNGILEDDVFIAGGTITFTGTANDDFRAGGGTITISGTIEGDVNIAGGQIYFDKNSVVKGDLTVAGGVVNLGGQVDSNVAIGAGEVTLSGTVGGNVEGRVDMLTVTDEASIAGNLTYTAPREANISLGASIGGETKYTQHTPERLGAYFGLIGLGIAGFFFNLIATFILLLAFVLLLKEFSQKIEREGTASFWKMLLIGLILLVVIPFAGVVLFVSIIGIPIALLLFVIYILILALGAVYANLLVGSYILRWIQKKESVALDWKVVLVGVIVLNAVVLVPIIGQIIGFIFFLAALGGVSLTLYQMFGDKK